MNSANSEALGKDVHTMYRNIVGCFMYISTTAGLDLSVVTRMSVSYENEPDMSDMAMGKGSWSTETVQWRKVCFQDRDKMIKLPPTLMRVGKINSRRVDVAGLGRLLCIAMPIGSNHKSSEIGEFEINRSRVFGARRSREDDNIAEKGVKRVWCRAGRISNLPRQQRCLKCEIGWAAIRTSVIGNISIIDRNSLGRCWSLVQFDWCRCTNRRHMQLPHETTFTNRAKKCNYSSELVLSPDDKLLMCRHYNGYQLQRVQLACYHKHFRIQRYDKLSTASAGSRLIYWEPKHRLPAEHRNLTCWIATIKLLDIVEKESAYVASANTGQWQFSSWFDWCMTADDQGIIVIWW